MAVRARTAQTETIGRPAHGYVQALDGLRAFAVLSVVLSHAGFPHTTGGKAGVLVFFVLSGYLITGILLREQQRDGRIAVGAFYARRALRLLPALTLATAAYFLVAVLWIPQTPLGQQTIVSTPAALFYFLNWWNIATSAVGFYGHYWSLAVEEQFYIVWPFLLILASRRWGANGVMWVAAGGALLSFLEKLVVPASSYRQTGTDFSADALLVGCAIAAGIVAYRPSPPKWLPAAAWIGVLLVAAAIVLGDSTRAASPFQERMFATVWWPISVLGSAALIAAAALDALPRQMRSVLTWRPIVYLGRISYAVYLWHVLLLWIFGTGIPMHGAAHLVVAVLASVAIAALSFHLVEQPFLRRKRRFERVDSPQESCPTTIGAPAS